MPEKFKKTVIYFLSLKEMNKVELNEIKKN